MTILTINKSAVVSATAPAAELPHLEPAMRGGSPHRGSGDQLFDGSDTLLDDGIMRSNWALPWSDLMMTMFVLFAALLVDHYLV